MLKFFLSLFRCLDSVTEERPKSKLMIYKVMASTGGKEEWYLDLGSLEFDPSVTPGHSSNHTDAMNAFESVTPTSYMETLTNHIEDVVTTETTPASVEPKMAQTIKRPTVVQRFLITCQRLRNLFNECSCVRDSLVVRLPESSSARSAVSSGGQSCGHIKDTGTSGCADLTTAVDAMETVMVRMALSLDDAATMRMKMEKLLSSGALKPLIDILVNHLRNLIFEYVPFTSTEVPGTSASTSTFPQWRETDHFSKYIYAIVERSLKPFLDQLLGDVLAESNMAYVDDSRRDTPSTSSSCIVIHENIVSLLTTMMTREIMNDLSGGPEEVSGHRSPSRGFTARTSGASDRDAVGDYTVTVCTEGVDKTSVCSEGKDYFSLVGIVLVQLMRKIEPSAEHMVDFTAFHSDLTEKILSEFCSTSGLSRNEAYPQSIKTQKICKKMYKDLLKSFISKDMVHKLLVYRLPVFSTVLTKSLVKELLQLNHKGDAERGHGGKILNFLPKFRLSRRLLAAFKKRSVNIKVKQFTLFFYFDNNNNNNNSHHHNHNWFAFIFRIP